MGFVMRTSHQRLVEAQRTQPTGTRGNGRYGGDQRCVPRRYFGSKTCASPVPWPFTYRSNQRSCSQSTCSTLSRAR